eukprot:jgi/Ulvmu1/10940/UM007_0119.1
MAGWVPCTSHAVRPCGAKAGWSTRPYHSLCSRTLCTSRAPVRAAALHSSTISVDGGDLEFLSCGTELKATAPPILFLHGAAHGAWCWAEHLMPEMEEAGITSYALSFRGHGKSFRATEERGAAAGTLLSHAADVATAIKTLPAAPILVGHSFGGLVLQRYLTAHRDDPEQFPDVAGVVLMGSSPPNGTDFTRYIVNSPVQSIKMTWSFITKNYLTSLPALRELFFSPGTPEADLQMYQDLLNEQSTPMQVVNLKQMKDEELPIAIESLREHEVPPAMVMRGGTDPIVDNKDCEDTASALRTSDILVFENAGHDLMLDTCWPQVSKAITEFASGIAV